MRRVTCALSSWLPGSTISPKKCTSPASFGELRILDISTFYSHICVHHRFRVIFIHFIPCVVLIFLNTKLILGVAAAEKKRNKLTNRNLKRDSKFKKNRRLVQKPKRRDSQRISVMSAIIISVFLIIEIPLMVITMLHALRPKVTSCIII